MSGKITDPTKLKELQDKRESLHNTITTYATDNEATWSAENDAKFAEMNADYDQVYSQIEAHIVACEQDTTREQAAAVRNERLQQMAGHGLRLPANVTNGMRSGGNGGSGRSQRQIQDGPLKGMSNADISALAVAGWMSGTAAYNNDRKLAACDAMGIHPGSTELRLDLLSTHDRTKALAEYHHGVMTGSPGEGLRRAQNVLTTGTGSSGGYTFDSSFIASLEIAMTDASGILETADVIRTQTGDLMSWPTVNDTANRGRLVTESAASTATDPTFGQVQWTAYKLGSDHILVPQELLDDNLVNLAQVIPTLLGERLGRGMNYYGTTGTGSSQPTGIVTASTLGVTAASATAITYDEIINLEHSINRALRNRAGVGYMFSDATLLLLRKLKDADNNYLWQMGNNSGIADRINNRPYTVNEDMPDATTGLKSVLFGCLSQFKVRMVREVRFYRLSELYRINDQDAFVAFMRFDTNLLNAGDNPVKHLIQA
jgi:HK97 family phage major capsid protein